MAEGDSRKQRRIYSTAVINQLVKDRNEGYEIDFEPFFNRDLELRAENIPFKMTEEELDEYQKCFDDPLYYCENYAKFMTDKGFMTVDLRPYQVNIIDKVTEEVYDEERDLLLPVNRNIILCCSRQTGKCGLTGSLSISYDKNVKVKLEKNIDDLYYDCIEHHTFLQRIKHILKRIYNNL